MLIVLPIHWRCHFKNKFCTLKYLRKTDKKSLSGFWRLVVPTSRNSLLPYAMFIVDIVIFNELPESPHISPLLWRASQCIALVTSSPLSFVEEVPYQISTQIYYKGLILIFYKIKSIFEQRTYLVTESYILLLEKVQLSNASSVV